MVELSVEAAVSRGTAPSQTFVLDGSPTILPFCFACHDFKCSWCRVF